MADQDVIFQFRSREYTHDDLSSIRQVISENFHLGRTHISRILARAWDWRQPNGKFKNFAVRDTLLRMQEARLIELPPPMTRNNNKAKKPLRAPLFDQTTHTGLVKDLSGLEIRQVSGYTKLVWKHLLQRYHYLGCPRIVGEHLCQAAMLGDQIVACLAWGSPAWKIAPRDQFIDWDEDTKRKNLHLVTSNVRFLIPPWVQVKHLASKVLALSLKSLRLEWKKLYGHSVYLAETFVDVSRFQGTTYKAANWIYLGQTKGSAKRGNSYSFHGLKKAIYVYPLHPKFRRWLIS
ncbi:MAG: Druantia anti-phage system protein DruA [Desulfohalobiaceae bacterium]